MYDYLEENNIDKLYIWLSDTTNGGKYLVEGNNIFIYQRMNEREGLFRAKRILPEGVNILQTK